MKELISDIRENSISHGSIPFWSWNDKLDEKELRRQINRMHELGMNGFFMHARGGLATEYLSDEWFDCVNACVDEAKKLGMEAWSYDENGWPSGFAGGKLLEDPINHATYLRCEKSSDYPTGEHILGVYKLENGKLSKAKCGDTCEYITIYQDFDPTYVDTMDDTITRKFIAQTHAVYKEKVGFGKHMPGFFTDEPQYFRYATPWTRRMPELFKDEFGYDVFSALPAMFIDFDGAEEFRYDYYSLCHKLFINNFVKVVYDWCEENGCQLTGHAVEESSLGGQMWSCGGIMPFYEYEHIPGMDYLGRPISSDLAPKQLGSVCAQLGKKKVLSEMFACCGWDVSPVELKKIAELQYAGGVNLMCQHLYSYSERGQRKRDYPAHYSEHLPWQEEMADFNRYFNNLGYTLSLGEGYVNTLVIHPIHSAYLYYKRLEGTNGMQMLENKSFELVNLLSSNQIPFHYGDENLMKRYAKIDGNRIKVGLCSYDYIIVPYCYTLDSNTVALLKDFIANGGKVWIFDGMPDRIDGRKADLSFLVSNTSFEDIKIASDIRLYKGDENADINSLRIRTRITENERIHYITNISDTFYRDIKVEIKGAAGAYALDMNTLEKKAVRGKCTESGIELLLNFDSVQSYVIVESNDVQFLPYHTSKQEKYITLCNNWIVDGKVENAINLDYAYFSYDGINYEDRAPFVAIKDRLLREKYNGKLWLKFTFDIKAIPSELFMAVEPLKYKDITINGQSVILTDKWWYDRSFKTADIVAYARKGMNEIVLSLDYFQRDYVYYVLYGGVSESLRNCLNFDTEIENIYLFGNFNVTTDSSQFSDYSGNAICYNGDFELDIPKAEINPYDIVKQGYPFFAGNITVKTALNYNEGDATVLCLAGRFAVAKIVVNGKYAGKLMFENKLDLADYLTVGDNEISITLYNSNRNLMGPHHRHDPEPLFVGPNTLSYENEWHNGKCDGYTDRYAFVRFGIDV